MVTREEWDAKRAGFVEELTDDLDGTIEPKQIAKMADRLMGRFYGEPPAPPPPERWSTTWGKEPATLATPCAKVEVLTGKPTLVRVVVADRNLLAAESLELEARLAQANAWVREHGS